MSTYILQKNFHTPIGKGLVGDKFIWNGSMYTPENRFIDRVYLRLSKEQVENNPEWFKKEDTPLGALKVNYSFGGERVYFKGNMRECFQYVVNNLLEWQSRHGGYNFDKEFDEYIKSI